MGEFYTVFMFSLQYANFKSPMQLSLQRERIRDCWKIKMLNFHDLSKYHISSYRTPWLLTSNSNSTVSNNCWILILRPNRLIMVGGFRLWEQESEVIFLKKTIHEYEKLSDTPKFFVKFPLCRSRAEGASTLGVARRRRRSYSWHSEAPPLCRSAEGATTPSASALGLSVLSNKYKKLSAI